MLRFFSSLLAPWKLTGLWTPTPRPQALGKRTPRVFHSSHRGCSIYWHHDVTEHANLSTKPEQARNAADPRYPRRAHSQLPIRLWDRGPPMPARISVWHTCDRPSGWNGRLVYTYGGGSEAGFFQGTSAGGVLQDALLSKGYRWRRRRST